MQRQFNLIKNDLGQHEKRILPRFPFCYLIFKTHDQHSPVFEVKDISHSGMQISLKNGTHGYEEGRVLKGNINWHGNELEISGKVMWKTSTRMGIEFEKNSKASKEIGDFLSIKNIVNSLRPIHKSNIGLEIPARLKYWLRGDGPVEIFVWQHSDGELSKIQILLMENFVEWEDGMGLRTGRALSKRNADTPLITEDEYVFQMDLQTSSERVEFALKIISDVPNDYLTKETIEFIKRKLYQ
jgi:hypothetical protein